MQISTNTIQSFLISKDINAESIVPCQYGVASQNFRATGANGLDVIVRCDLRRPLREVLADCEYMEVARHGNINVPQGEWIYGEIDGTAVVVRPTIPGQILTDIAVESQPAFQTFGAILGRVHRLDTTFVPTRSFFYDFLFDSKHPRWQQIESCDPYLVDTAELVQLIAEARLRLRSARRQRKKLRMGPSGFMHGDFTPRNMLISETRDVFVLDWEKACVGPQLCDVAQAIFHFCCFEDQARFLTEVAPFAECYGLQVSPSILWLWVRSFAACFFMTDAAFAAMNRRSEIAFIEKRELYFLDYCVPTFRRYLMLEDGMKKNIIGMKSTRFL